MAGGGAVCAYGNTTMNNATLIKNAAFFAGGGVLSYGMLTILNSAIIGNIGGTGGGGVAAEVDVNINNTTIRENETLFIGGGVMAINNLTITNSSVSYNTAQQHGGGGLTGKIVTITNCTINGNFGGVNGGGVAASQEVNITNSTVVGNQASARAGGVYGNIINITGSIVALNTVNGGQSRGDLSNGNSTSIIATNGGYNIFSEIPAGIVASDQTGVWEPQLNLGALADNGGPTRTILPGAGSIAIGKGDPTDQTKDQRGQSWVQATTRSVGAVNTVASALPVTLISFTGNAINNQAVLLKWATAAEINNSGFEILRSVDNGKTFTKIAFVNSLAPEGNRTGSLSYTYEDNSPFGGRNLYRLRQIDLDGSYSNSRIISILVNSQLLLSPNPTTDILNIRGAEGSNYQIFNKIGQSIKEGVFENAIDVADLSTGTYILHVKGNVGQIQTMKFVKK